MSGSFSCLRSCAHVPLLKGSRAPSEWNLVVNAKFRFEAVFARQFDVLLVHGLAVRLFRGGPFLFAFVLLISIALLVWHEFSFPHGVRVTLLVMRRPAPTLSGLGSCCRGRRLYCLRVCIPGTAHQRMGLFEKRSGYAKFDRFPWKLFSAWSLAFHTSTRAEVTRVGAFSGRSSSARA